MGKNNQNAAEMQQEENTPEVQKPESAPEVQKPESTPEVQAQTEKAAQEEDPYKKMVRVKLPIIKGERTDVMVGVNGKFWQIKRGVYVDIPEPVAEVLQHQEEMELQAAELEEKLEAQADKM